eukprot:GHVN01034326.1.p2 GENE.GHVN01034326.1~~GHVN01034326.1.p2  ORF type:complete len:136 (+),score=11.39 GHVN01034326.1:1441-1848(+)
MLVAMEDEISLELEGAKAIFGDSIKVVVSGRDSIHLLASVDETDLEECVVDDSAENVQQDPPEGPKNVSEKAIGIVLDSEYPATTPRLHGVPYWNELESTNHRIVAACKVAMARVCAAPGDLCLVELISQIRLAV